MEKKHVIALIKIVEDNVPGIVEENFKEPFLADKHLLWEEVLKFCVRYNIKGDKFKKFINNCCSRKFAKAIITTSVLEEGMYSKKLIDLNLSLEKPVPFIEEKRTIYKKTAEEKKFNPTQRSLFMARFLYQKQHEEKDTESYQEPKIIIR